MLLCHMPSRSELLGSVLKKLKERGIGSTPGLVVGADVVLVFCGPTVIEKDILAFVRQALPAHVGKVYHDLPSMPIQNGRLKQIPAGYSADDVVDMLTPGRPNPAPTEPKVTASVEPGHRPEPTYSNFLMPRVAVVQKYPPEHRDNAVGGASQLIPNTVDMLYDMGYDIKMYSVEQMEVAKQRKRFQPDVTLLNPDASEARGCIDGPVIQWCHDVVHMDTGWSEYAALLTPSEYVADYAREQGCDIPIVVSEPGANRFHAFVEETGDAIGCCSMGDTKGGRVFEAIAKAMPDQRFICTTRAKKGKVVKNLEYWPAQHRMTHFYKETGVLVQASQVPEAYCVAVAEALANGIPCVVSDLGYLSYWAEQYPKMIFMVPHDAPTEEWAKAVKKASRQRKKQRVEGLWSSKVSDIAILLDKYTRPVDRKVSICITLRNRADYMRGFIEDLKRQTYNLKDVELCVSDGNSTDNIRELLQEYAYLFDRVTYAISDRDALPYGVPGGNPAADINSQVCNLATYDKIIRTDAEMRLEHEDTIAMVADELDRDPKLCVNLPALRLRKGFDFPAMGRPGPNDGLVEEYAEGMSYKGEASTDAFFCSCFTKTAFIANGGVDERFCGGFAGEDSYFHWWWRKNRNWKSPKGFRALHLWHPNPAADPEKIRLRAEVTLPLLAELQKGNIPPNSHLEAGHEDDWQRPEMIKDRHEWRDKPHGLSVHCMVKNEYLLPYAVKSVYDYADEILLYDNGTYAKYAITKQKELLEWDKARDKKIRFMVIETEADTEQWTLDTVCEWSDWAKGHKTKGDIRQQMIDDTSFSHFMILDGDEVHYDQTMRYIRHIIDRWPNKMLCMRVPLAWHYNLDRIHSVGGGVFGCSGRVFRSGGVVMDVRAVGEMHCNRHEHEVLERGRHDVGFADHVYPYAHFERMMKPWRRDVAFADTSKSPYDLPETIRCNMGLMDEYLSGRRSLIAHYFANDGGRHRTALDVGCGVGNILAHLNVKRKVGIDLHGARLDEARRFVKDGKGEVIKMDVRNIMERFDENAFDLVVLFDIVEHLPKDQGRKLLMDAQKVAKKSVVAFIPVGEHPQHEEGDPLMDHLATWMPEEVADLGFEVWYFEDWHTQEGKEPGALFAVNRFEAPCTHGKIYHNLLCG